MNAHLHPLDFCLDEDEAASILINTYGPHEASAIIQSTEILFYVHYTRWEDLARALHYGNDVFDFVIDDASGLAFVGVAAHVQLIPTLLWAKTGKQPGDITEKYERMDEWVIEGHGCFKSKAGGQILMSRNYLLHPELSILSYRSTVIE